MSATTSHVKNVVICGGGFAGVRLARLLAFRPNLKVTLISDRDSFAYYGQLYHVATGGVRTGTALPLKYLLGNANIELVTATVTAVDHAKKVITTDTRKKYHYDYAAVALGMVTNYFGIPGLEEFSYNIKTIEGAERFKTHLHRQLVEQRKADAHYVVVGAGPTGVELSGALTEYLKRIGRLHGLDLRYQVDLVEASPRVLPRSSEKASRKVEAHLRRLGVNVMTGTAVKGETARKLKLGGEQVSTQTVVWTSGVANNPFYAANPSTFELAKGNKVVVDGHMQARDGLYVMGDSAATPFSGLAESAINDANYVAGDIIRRSHGQKRPQYKPKHPHPVTPVGPGWAVAELGPINLYGRLGWAIRRIADLIAYRDIESLPQALRSWLSEPARQDLCEICQPVAATGLVARKTS